MAGIVTMFFQIILFAYSQPSILLRNPDQSAAENCKKKTDKEENDSLQGCSIMANLLFCCMEYLLQRKMAWLSLQTMYAYTQHSFLGERHVLTYSATTVSSRFGLVRCNDGLKQHYIQCF